jgi:hypothetical protein
MLIRQYGGVKFLYPEQVLRMQAIIQGAEHLDRVLEAKNGPTEPHTETDGEQKDSGNE